MKDISNKTYFYVKNDEEKSKERMNEGTLLHKYCQDFLEDTGSSSIVIDKQYEKIFHVVLNELSKITILNGVELNLMYLEHEWNSYTSREDIIGKYSGQLCIIDLKFTRVKKEDN